jgi:hypothetical protein
LHLYCCSSQNLFAKTTDYNGSLSVLLERTFRVTGCKRTSRYPYYDIGYVKFLERLLATSQHFIFHHNHSSLIPITRYCAGNRNGIETIPGPDRNPLQALHVLQTRSKPHQDSRPPGEIQPPACWPSTVPAVSRYAMKETDPRHDRHEDFGMED